jgi:tetratricopeptide (TPR) repeat protein
MFGCLCLLSGLAWDEAVYGQEPQNSPKVVGPSRARALPARAASNVNKKEFADEEDYEDGELDRDPFSGEVFAQTLSRFPSLDQLKAVVADARAKHDLLTANYEFILPDVAKMLEDPETKSQAWSFVEQLQLLVDRSSQIDDRAFAQALIARLDKVMGKQDLAEKNYKAALAIAQSKKESGFRFDLRSLISNPLYNKLPQRCRIALGLLYCGQNKISDAEQIYSDLMKGFYAQTWFSFPRDTKTIYASRVDGNDGTELSALAAALGRAYDISGATDKAAAKFADLIAFSNLENANINESELISRLRLFKIITGWDMNTGEPVQIPDAIVGPEASYLQALREYVVFSSKHPSLCNKTDIAKINSKIERLESRFLATEMAAKESHWCMSERFAFGLLHTDPQKALKVLHKELTARKAAHAKVADPGLCPALQKISFQLIEAGFYNEAESFINEAIALNSAAGKSALPALGANYSNLVLLNLQKGQLPAAESLLLKALKLRALDIQDPIAQTKTNVIYGSLLFEQAKLIQAEAVLDAALQKLGKFIVPPKAFSVSDALQMIVQQNPRYGVLSAAAADVQSAAYIWHTRAVLQLGQVYIAAGKYEQAREILQKALEKPALYSDRAVAPLVHVRLAQLAVATGKTAEAASELDQAESLAKDHHVFKPVYVEINLARAALCKRVNQKAEAKKYYENAAKLLEQMLGPKNVRVLALRKLVSAL